MFDPKEYQKAYRELHREKRNAYYRSYQKVHKEEIKERRKEYKKNYYETNKKKINEQQKEYRKWNRMKRRTCQKNYRKLNRDKVNFYSRIRGYREKNSEGSHTFGEWETLKAQYNWTCPCCGKQEPVIKLTEDHIIPLSRGGSNNIENIQPLCKSCNSKKHTNIVRYSLKDSITEN